ncbi:MAG: helix-turn-helix domain-containing protein [Paenibacillaceae bacterium]|nr:helix-turn-helix domain-containing protein [Paenibacillaceae bacterium]
MIHLNERELDELLRTRNELEQAAYAEPRRLVFEGDELSIPYLASAESVESAETTAPDIVPESFLLDPGQKIAFSKHPRYAYVRDHRHSFIELNYVYSGSCTQTINGNRVTMREGEICLLDTNVVHSFEPAGDHDIVINCIMRTSYFNTDMLGRLSGNDILSHFFIDAVYRSTERGKYLLFPTHGNDRARQWIIGALGEFYDPGLCSAEAINSFMALLFCELLRVYRKQRGTDGQGNKGIAALADILTYLESNYRDVTLESAAQHFHFHPNYLSRVLKQSTGQSFIRILTDVKMKKARILLENTDFPVGKIASEIGYSNVKFFYDRFKEACGMTPGLYRQQARDNDRRGL